MYSEDNSYEISKFIKDIETDCDKLVRSWIARNYKTAKAQEYAQQGFCRRLRTIARCIQNIYALAPVNVSEKMSDDDRANLTINLQSYILNIWGALDNLAGVLVCELNIKQSNGKDLSNLAKGLGPKCKEVRSHLLDNGKRLTEFDEWFHILKSYRDALAHKIPLYVPPALHVGDDALKYNALEAKAFEVFSVGNYKEYLDIVGEQEKLGRFAPVMAHSYAEEGRLIYFQGQIVADWNTLKEISEMVAASIDGAGGGT